jgi:hypothetical protein
MFSQSFESMISITITSYFRDAKIGGKILKSKSKNTNYEIGGPQSGPLGPNESPVPPNLVGAQFSGVS